MIWRESGENQIAKFLLSCERRNNFFFSFLYVIFNGSQKMFFFPYLHFSTEPLKTSKLKSAQCFFVLFLYSFTIMCDRKNPKTNPNICRSINCFLVLFCFEFVYILWALGARKGKVSRHWSFKNVECLSIYISFWNMYFFCFFSSTSASQTTFYNAMMVLVNLSTNTRHKATWLRHCNNSVLFNFQ